MEKQNLLVCTAHIHWDPEFCDVKLIQVGASIVLHSCNCMSSNLYKSWTSYLWTTHYNLNGHHQFHSNPCSADSGFVFNFELYRGYLNTRCICHDLLNKSLISLNAMRGRIGKLVASHAEDCRVNSRQGQHRFILCTRCS